MPKTDASNNHCPVFYAVSRLGDKWSLLIIRDLMFFGKRHYKEFLEAGEGISTNILADRLAKLEAEGIVSKTPDPEHGSRVLYGLTEKGLALMPVLLAIVDWSATWDDHTAAPPGFIDLLRSDPERLMQHIREQYEKDASMFEGLPV